MCAIVGAGYALRKMDRMRATQLVRVEWLWKVIIRAALEPLDAISSCPSRCQHQYRNIRALPDPFQHLDPSILGSMTSRMMS